MTRHRNADSDIRSLERRARQSGTTEDLVVWWRALVRAGSDTGDATLATWGVCGRSGFAALLERLLSMGSIRFEARDDDEVAEAIRRASLAAPSGSDYCETNECDEPTCHRCYPREGCRLHEKCREFTRGDVAEVVDTDVAETAERWLILQRALNDATTGWWGSPDLPEMGEVNGVQFAWIEWADEAIQPHADALSVERFAKIQDLLRNATREAWALDYPACLERVREAALTLENHDDDAFVCSRCERRAYRYGRYRCGECGERFCNLCENEGGAHGGAHSCYGRCITPGCSNELDATGESDYCTECQDEDAASENPYYGRSGSGLMLFSPDLRRVLLELRSNEVEEPGTWGNPGGKTEGRDLYQSALRETEEELGRVPLHAVFGEVVYRDGEFSYTTFLAALDPSEEGWEPDELNWESDDAAWFDVTSMPEDLHFGVRHIMQRKPELFR